MPHPMPLSCIAECLGNCENPRTWKGLSAEDRDIFRAHLALQTFAAEPVYFNVPCGSAPASAHELEQATGLPHLDQLYYKRCDLVCRVGDTWRIVEIKPAAGYVALGQAIAYQHLLAAAHQELRDSRPTVLTDAADPDLLYAYAAHGVDLLQLRDATYEPRGRPT